MMASPCIGQPGRLTILVLVVLVGSSSRGLEKDETNSDLRNDELTGFYFSQNERELAAGTRSGIAVLDVKSGKLLRSLELQPPASPRYSRLDGQRYLAQVVVGDPFSLSVFSSTTRERIQDAAKLPLVGSGHVACDSSCSRWYAVGGETGREVTCYSIAEGKALWTFKTSGFMQIRTIALSHDDRLLLVASNALHLCDAQTGRLLVSRELSNVGLSANYQMPGVFSADDSRIFFGGDVSGTAEERLVILKTATLGDVAKCTIRTPLSEQISGFAGNRCLDVCAAITSDYTHDHSVLHVWYPNRRILNARGMPRVGAIREMTMSRSGKFLFVAGRTHLIMIALPNGKVLWQRQMDPNENHGSNTLSDVPGKSNEPLGGEMGDSRGK